MGATRSVAVRKAKADQRAADLRPVIESLRASGIATLRKIADALNERSIPAARGGTWSATQVLRIVQRGNNTSLAVSHYRSSNIAVLISLASNFIAWIKPEFFGVARSLLPNSARACAHSYCPSVLPATFRRAVGTSCFSASGHHNVGSSGWPI